ncbi:hypothetical protein CRG98_012119, partial [Punica granatum]
MEDPASKGEESPKKVPATSSSSGGRRGKEVSVNAVNTAHQASQQYSANFTSTPPVAPSYTPHAPQYRPQPPTQPIYYSAPPPPPPSTVPSPVVHHCTPTPSQNLQYQPPAPRISQPTQRAPPPQAPGPSFDPTIQDQSKQCEYHRGAPGHTLDACWRLRERIQEMIDAKELVFNTVRSPNVQANPLPDHGPARGSSINMITVCTSREGESEQGCPSPFVIEYVPAEAAVGFTGIDAPPAPFIKDIPAREPYSNDRVPWTYEGGVEILEQQFGTMSSPLKDAHIPGHCTLSAIATTILWGRVMIDNGSALNVCPVTTLKQMNVDLNRVRQSKTAVRAYDGSRREVNGEIDLLIEVGPCFFSVTFQVFNIPNAFSLLLGRPWIHLADAVPSSLHQKLKFIVEDRLITVKGEEDYAICKETAVPYISVRNDENLPFHSFETISIIRNYGEIRLSCADRMIGKVLLRHNYIAGTGLGARGQGISRPIEECLGEPRPIYFGEGLDEDSQAPEIEESLHRLEGRQLTSVEPTEEIDVGTENEPRTLKIGSGLDPTQRARMIDFLTRYQEVFAWSYADMLGLDASIVKHFLPLDTEKFPPKRQQLRRQRASLLLRIKEEIVKQIDAGFLEVCNYSEWVANIVPVEKKDGRVRVCVDYRDLNKASPKDNFPLLHIDVLVDNTAQYKLRLNPAKCMFGARSGKLLGFVVSERGIEVDPDKVKEIRELPPPSSVREVRGFLGRLNYIARFITNLTDKCQPLFRLLRKNVAIEWNEECQKAFDTIKAYPIQPPADPLKYLLDSPSSMQNIAKWRCQLTEYDIEYVSRTSIKGQVIADHLAEFPIEGNTPIDPNFPDEGILQVDDEREKLEWKMYFDGAVNSTGSGIGA